MPSNSSTQSSRLRARLLSLLLGVRSPALTALTLAFGASCVSPTIPLPPPEVPEVRSSTEPGHIHLRGVRGVQPDAIVVVFNHNPSVPRDKRVGGAQADAEGSWECDVVAASGDLLEVSQQVKGERSDSITFQVR